jgi:hypothetical protein
MRGKRSGHASGMSYNGNLKQSHDDDTSSDSVPQSTAGAASGALSSFSTKSAADMFAAYSNYNLDIDVSCIGQLTGKGGESSASPADTLTHKSSGGTLANHGKSSSGTASGSALLADIKDGAERLANELDEYLSRGSRKAFIPSKDSPPLSDEAVADLQLATARKLREVSKPAFAPARIYWLLVSVNEHSGCSGLLRCCEPIKNFREIN